MVERNAYHRGVKLVEHLPLLLFHNIDLLIVKNLLLGQVTDDGSRIVAKRTIATGEEGEKNSTP